MQPNLNDITLPLLRILADGKIHRSRDLHKLLEGSSQKVPIGLDNQVRQSRACLVHACLIQRLSRRRCRISSMGQGVLRKNPQAIDAYLAEQLTEFQEFPIPKTQFSRSVNLTGIKELSTKKTVGVFGILPHLLNSKGKDSCFRRNDNMHGNEVCVNLEKSKCFTVKDSKSNSHASIFQNSDENPEEAIESLYQTLRQSLAADLLGKIKRVSPSFFEQLVVDVLVAMGYGGSRQDAAQILGRSGDGGVDGIIKEDQLGLDVIYIQAKRWENPVGRPEIQGFAGSLEGFRARKGVFMTTSRFTKEAREYVERIASRIILIEGQQLADLMIDFNVGTSEYQRYVIKKMDSEYFEEA